jgi:TolB-like protein
LHAANADTILIAGFLNQGADADDNINIVLTKSLISLLSKVPGIQVVPYDTVKESVDGNHLWSQDTANMELVEAMGLILGAKKVVFGDYKIDNRTSNITGHYSVYNVQTGEVVMTRVFEGPAGMDVFDTIDGVVKKVTFALVGQEIALANVAVKIGVPDNSYRVYINGQPQGIATSAEIYKIP